MHPNVFLKTFWRMELKPQVFVAMSFSELYQSRFDNVIAPAISSIDGAQLKAYRVDLSKSGDSILTDIIEGIAHSQMVVADVSTVGKDSVTGDPYRNGNVMYEVGIALACRLPQEILLIRDDNDKFLFDVSTIPHIRLDFTNPTQACDKLRDEIKARLDERNYINDARIQIAISSLSFEEVEILKTLAELQPGHVWGRAEPLAQNAVDFVSMAAIPRLLDKQLIRVVGKYGEQPAYVPTPFGQVVASMVKMGLRQLKNEKTDA